MSRLKRWKHLYTSNQRTKKKTKTQNYKKLRQDLKPHAIKQAENELSKFSASTVAPTKYSYYIRARENEVLSNYYANEDKQENYNLLPFRKMKLPSIIYKKQSDSRPGKALQSKFEKTRS